MSDVKKPENVVLEVQSIKHKIRTQGLGGGNG